MINRKIPHPSQPQYPVGIDQGNLLTKSLVAVISSVTGTNLVDNTPLNGLSGAGVIHTPNNGLVADFIGKASTSKVTSNFLLTSPTSTTPGDRTYFIPFLRSGAGGGNFGRLFQKGSNECYLMEDVGTNTFVFVQSTSGGGNLSTQRFGPAGGLSAVVGWHTMAVSITAAGTVLMYLDGVSQGLTASTYTNGATTQTGAFVLGNRSTDNARVWNGQLGNLSIFDSILTVDQIQQLINNQWQVFQPQTRRIWVPGTGGTDTPVNPGVGSFAITGYSPTVTQTANQAITPNVGNIVITGYAPTISQPQAVNPGVGSITITGYAPTVTQNVDVPVNPGVGTIAITGYAPTVAQTENQSVSPAAGTIAITGYVPTLAQTANQAIIPDVGTITITGYAPTVQQAAASQNITPGVGILTITGYAPTISQSQSGGVGGALSAYGFNSRLPKTRRQIEQERIDLGIIPDPVARIAEKIARKAIKKAIEKHEPDIAEWTARNAQKIVYERQLKAELAHHDQVWNQAYQRLFELAVHEALLQREEEETLLLLLMSN